MTGNASKRKYPNTFYIVSLKAIIRDNSGRVLLVKESGSDSWSFPGGGIDHGESELDGLRRELEEEIDAKGSFDARPIGIDQMWLDSKQAYLMWIVYEVIPGDDFSWGIGVDGDESAYIDPLTLRTSPRLGERLIYKWTVDRSYDPYIKS